MRKWYCQTAKPDPIRTKARSSGNIKVKMAAATIDMGRVELNHSPRSSAVIKAAEMLKVKSRLLGFAARVPRCRLSRTAHLCLHMRHDSLLKCGHGDVLVVPGVELIWTDQSKVPNRRF